MVSKTEERFLAFEEIFSMPKPWSPRWRKCFIHRKDLFNVEDMVSETKTMFSAIEKIFSIVQKIFSVTEKIFSITEKIFSVPKTLSPRR